VTLLLLAALATAADDMPPAQAPAVLSPDGPCVIAEGWGKGFYQDYVHERGLTAVELSGCRPYAWVIAKNVPFAAVGHPFKTAWLANWFERAQLIDVVFDEDERNRDYGQWLEERPAGSAFTAEERASIEMVVRFAPDFTSSRDEVLAYLGAVERVVGPLDGPDYWDYAYARALAGRSLPEAAVDARSSRPHDFSGVAGWSASGVWFGVEVDGGEVILIDPKRRLIRRVSKEEAKPLGLVRSTRTRLAGHEVRMEVDGVVDPEFTGTVSSVLRWDETSEANSSFCRSDCVLVADFGERTVKEPVPEVLGGWNGPWETLSSAVYWSPTTTSVAYVEDRMMKGGFRGPASAHPSDQVTFISEDGSVVRWPEGPWGVVLAPSADDPRAAALAEKMGANAIWVEVIRPTAARPARSTVYAERAVASKVQSLLPDADVRGPAAWAHQLVSVPNLGCGERECERLPSYPLMPSVIVVLGPPGR